MELMLHCGDSGTVTMGSSTGATVSASGIININNTTEATNTTDGSYKQMVVFQ